VNLALLETFAAVMRSGSATRAAELLGVSQPAVSRALRRLEDTTGLKLFEREGRRIQATPEAQALYGEVLAARAGLDRVRQAAARLKEVGTGTLRVASSAAFGLHLLPRVIEAFLRDRPDVSVTLEVASSAVVRDLVASGTYDLGVCADEVDRTGVIAEGLSETAGVTVLRGEHPLARLPCIRPDDLDGVAFAALAPEDRARRRLDSLLAGCGARPRVVVETPFGATVCEFALLGTGIGLANWLVYAAGDFEARGLVARPFAPAITFRSLLLLPAGRGRSRFVEELVGGVRRAVADLPRAPRPPVRRQ
jgi:DNA-binding transcriptional LysR family regulator